MDTTTWSGRKGGSVGKDVKMAFPLFTCMANDLRASTNKHAYWQCFGLYGMGWENGLKWQTIASLMSPHVRELTGTDENDLITVQKCDKRRLRCKRVRWMCVSVCVQY